MSLEAMERETCFGWDDSTKLCELTTYNRAMITKLKKLCKQHPQTYKIIDEYVYDGKTEGYCFEFPKNLITLRAPTQRKMSEENKQAAAERMRKMRKEIAEVGNGKKTKKKKQDK